MPVFEVEYYASPINQLAALVSDSSDLRDADRVVEHINPARLECISAVANSIRTDGCMHIDAKQDPNAK